MTMTVGAEKWWPLMPRYLGITFEENAKMQE